MTWRFPNIKTPLAYNTNHVCVQYEPPLVYKVNNFCVQYVPHYCKLWTLSLLLLLFIIKCTKWTPISVQCTPLLYTMNTIKWTIWTPSPCYIWLPRAQFTTEVPLHHSNGGRGQIKSSHATEYQTKLRWRSTNSREHSISIPPSLPTFNL